MEKSLQPQEAPVFVLGIDVSKDSLDVCLVCCGDGRQLSHKANNNPAGFRRMKSWLKQQGCEAGPETLACMEHTGLYTRQLVHYLLAIVNENGYFSNAVLRGLTAGRFKVDNSVQRQREFGLIVG